MANELYGFKKNLEKVQVRSKSESAAKSHIVPVRISNQMVKAPKNSYEYTDLEIDDLENWNVVVLRCQCRNVVQNIIYFRGLNLSANHLVDYVSGTKIQGSYVLDWNAKKIRVSWISGTQAIIEASTIAILAVYGLVQNVNVVDEDSSDEPAPDEGDDIDISALTDEVLGIRIGEDGTIYDTAGQAVRSQIGGLRDLLNVLDVEDAVETIQNAVDTAIEQIETAGGLILDDTLTQSGQAADAGAVGDEIGELKSYLNTKINKETIFVDDFENGYYSTVNGTKQNNSSSTNYSRTKELIPADENTLYVSNVNVIAACYDKDKNFISGITIYTKTSAFKRPITPTGTAYVGLSATNPPFFQLEKVDASNVQSIEYPYVSDDYIHIESYWCNGSGNLSSTSNFDLLIVPVAEGERWYVSNEASYNLLCFDQSGMLLTATYETRSPIGKIVTVPTNAKTMCVNLYRNRTKGVNTEMSDYVARVGSEKVLAIGDSLTWLDGRANYGGMAYFSGWQRQLRLAGYDVINAGWSGYPYATGIDVVDGVDYSIYKQIVTDAYTVSGYDYIILFGGTNDVLYGGALGDRPTDYANRTFDSSKFNGAIGAIIDYIRANNTTAKILLASFPKSEAVTRSYANAKLRVDEIEYNSDFWSCKYINVFADMNVQPTYEGFDLYFYDATHPNFDGMQIIGKLMLNAVKSYD